MKLIDLTFKPLDPINDIESSLDFRLDTYIESFQTDKGFGDSVGGSFNEYQATIISRMAQGTRRYIRAFYKDQVLGQLEYAFTSPLPELGYINLFYLVPEWRGKGIANLLMDYLVLEMKQQQLKGILLSVSKTNQRAQAFYKKYGFTPAPLAGKRRASEYLQFEFSDS